MESLHVLTTGDVAFWVVLAVLVGLGVAGIAWAHGHAAGARSERGLAADRYDADVAQAVEEFGPGPVRVPTDGMTLDRWDEDRPQLRIARYRADGEL